jgi:hypothetical protein
MVWLQALTGAASVGVVLAALSMLWPRLQGTLRLVLPSNGTSMQEVLPMVLLIALGLLAAPVVFYFAVPKD